MGYLINPIGFRVGQTTNWVDTFFSSKEFYPEFLHFVLKIRLFLNFYLNSFPTEEDYMLMDERFSSFFRSAVLFSHYKLVFNLISVHISLFLYPGKFWDSLYNYWTHNNSSNKVLSFNLFKSLDYRKNFSLGMSSANLSKFDKNSGKGLRFLPFFKRPSFKLSGKVLLTTIFDSGDLSKLFFIKKN